ncbi:MAG: rod shape-determining protein RodA [Steroidobacteraceae bacterium]|nr:rod shape-determining protein RodA [Steroidobacteraceae bacterium]
MAGTGHHHLLIDVELPPLDQPVPADDHHLHFGKGQTEAVVTLAPGKHRLQLLLADHLHLPHEPSVASEPITITVR